MNRHSDAKENNADLRDKLIGLGDVSMRKSYYPELQERLDELERFKTLLDHCNDYIFLARAADGALIDVSASARSQLGYEEETLKKTSIYDLFFPGLLEPLIEKLSGQAAETEEKIMLVTDLKGGDGAFVPVEISFRIVVFASLYYVVIVARDITERKRSMDELRRAHDQLEEKVESRTQELMAANEELRAINEELQNAFTQLTKMHNQLVEAEKMAALGSMVAGVAHEINTPVGLGVTLASHLAEITQRAAEKMTQGVLRRQELTEYFQDCQEAAQILLGNLNRTANLVQSFKQVSVDQISEQQRSFNVRDYLEDILRSLHSRLKKTKHRIAVECRSELVIDSYPGPFAQVVMNLLMNSLTHAYADEDAGNIKISFLEEGDEFVLLYQDDGKGIAPDALSKIFDPFFTGNRSGGNTGLGLHILYNIVRQIFKGTVSCRSSLNEGAVFEIRFPKLHASIE